MDTLRRVVRNLDAAGDAVAKAEKLLGWGG
jgi:hypothetical protein